MNAIQHSQVILRLLGRALRHRCHENRLSIDAQGWAEIDAAVRFLNERLADAGQWWPVSIEALLELLTEAKDRFETRSGRIRARYGHSLIHVTVGTPRSPPAILFHGTSQGCLDSVRVDGLRPGSRTAVHLTSDKRYSQLIAEGSGSPMLLAVLAAEAASQGVEFRQATEHVWLAAPIPPRFVSFDDPRNPAFPSFNLS